MKISDKVESMQFSPIRRFNPMGFKAEADGKKVYHLNIGQPDVETPSVFMDAIREYDKKVIAYAESGGINDLRDAVVDYFKGYDIDFGRDDIMVTTGGSEALNMTFLTILNEGDEVLIAEPFYTNYHTFITAAGGKVVPITTKAEEGYHYAKRDQIEACITPKTKAIVCINPGNPTGTVLTLDEMKLIGEIAKEHDLWIIADEVYREFVYDDRKLASFGMLPEFADRVVIIDSVSKRYSACGARIGFAISKNQDFCQGLMKIAQGRLCVSTVDQVGSAALFRLPKSYYDEVKAEYNGRRDVVYEELMKIPGVVCQKPGGAFYLTAKLPVDDVEDFLVFLLTEFEDNGETVMFAPAAGFYATPGLGKDEMRIAYVLNKEDMRRGTELIKLGIEAYNKKLGK
ncbi:MAG: pyridoxal phosphate-dependent aminotransferase [Clostridia bacterium]|nr:pyridoxal phosphate-dependent aminotransferase [Clostridia bacterium]